jgi:hypothetical protein
MKKTELDRVLTSIYYDAANPASFGGVNTLLTHVNKLLLESQRPPLRRQVVQDWLRSSEAYTTHKPSRDKFKRNPIKVNYVHEIWQADPIFYPDLAKYNKGYAYVLAVLDTASRFLYISFMKRKTSLECLRAFKEILAQAGTKPKFLMVDMGTEFKGVFQTFLKENDIHMYSKKSGSVKVPHLDRAWLKIQNRLHRLFDANESRDILTNLPKLVHSYNDFPNRSIGMTPREALSKWTVEIDKRLQQNFPSEKKKVRVGQLVRILGEKAGHHTYKGDWTFEIFRISKVVEKAERRTRYYVKALNGEEVSGVFYAEELQLVKRPLSKEYKIEKIIKYRTFKGRKQAFVKWSKLDKSQNSWVDVKAIRDL